MLRLSRRPKQLFGYIAVLFACTNLYATTTSGSNDGKTDPLFAQTDSPTLSVEIHLPLKELLRKKKSKHSVDGNILFAGSSLPVSIEPRGKSRLVRCKFPPLWLDFKKSTTKDTIFAGQNKLKLVTHCANNLEPRGFLAAEMLAYRLLNLFTDKSFRVRAVQITYTDTSNQRSETHHGFLIEHKKRMSKRLNLHLIEQTRLRRGDLDAHYTSLANLFQFMIGNTDFSFSQGPEGDDCCHNSVPTQGDSDYLASIPYDFDSSGLVNPPYAVPAETLGLKRLTQRRFRGFCRHNSALPAVRADMLAAKEQVFEIAENFDAIPDLKKDKARKFLSQFYEILESDKSFQRKIVKACRDR